MLTFSLGFGPKLLSFKRGDTEYCLSLIPLGGYVKMAGENPDDNPQGASDEFLSKSKWQRFQILLAGPAMNMILAVLRAGRRADAGRPRAGVPEQAGRDRRRAGRIRRRPRPASQPGDEIVTINGRAISTWEELDMAVSSKPDLDVEFVRAPRTAPSARVTVRPATTKVTLQADTTFEVGTIGVLPDTYPLIDAVNPGDPADKAGVQRGDKIKRIEGARMVDSRNVSELLRTRGGQPTTIVVEPRRQRADAHGHARAARRHRRHRRHAGQRDDLLHAGSGRGARAERAAQRADGRPHPAHARRALHRAGLAQAAHGAGGHRARCRASRRAAAGWSSSR